MIKGNQSQLNRMHVVLDALVIAFSYAMSWFILFGITKSENTTLPASFYFSVLLIILPHKINLYFLKKIETAS